MRVLFLVAFVIIVTCSCVSPPAENNLQSDEASIPAEQPTPIYTGYKTSLSVALDQYLKNPDKRIAFIRISPEWVGTVRRSYYRSIFDINREDIPEDIRFGHVFSSNMPWQKKKHFRIARIQGGGYSIRFAPAYYKTLPENKEIIKCTTAAELDAIFEVYGHGFDGRTAEWALFTRSSDTQIEYLRVFVGRVFGRKSSVTPFQSLEIRRGAFRPANPESAAEIKKYKSGDQLFEERQQAQAKKRATYPTPLRDLLYAREVKSGLGSKHYSDYLSEFRKNPNRILLKQILKYAHQDSVRFGKYLNAIFIGERYLHISPWDPENQHVALKYLIDALSETHERRALVMGVEPFLIAIGGGHLDIRDPRSDKRFGVDVNKRYRKNKLAMATSHLDYSPAIVRLVQKEFRAMLKEKAVK